MEDARKVSDEIGQISEKRKSFLSQMRKLVGILNFAQTSVVGKVGRVALRSLEDLLIRRAGWALQLVATLLPKMASMVPKLRGSAADVGIFSDACTADGGTAAIALFAKPRGELMALLRGAAEKVLLGSLYETNEISAWTCPPWYQLR